MKGSTALTTIPEDNNTPVNRMKQKSLLVTDIIWRDRDATFQYDMIICTIGDVIVSYCAYHTEHTHRTDFCCTLNP